MGHIACQTEEVSAAYLNSNDAFALIVPKKNKGWLWLGKGVQQNEERAQQVLCSFQYTLFFNTFLWQARLVEKLLNAKSDFSFETISECEEPAEFWSDIGGEIEYPNSKRFPEVVEAQQKAWPNCPRLWIAAKTGIAYAAEEEVCPICELLESVTLGAEEICSRSVENHSLCFPRHNANSLCMAWRRISRGHEKVGHGSRSGVCEFSCI